MARTTPITAFEANISDAERLIGLSSALTNARQRKMHCGLQERFGRLMRIPKKQWKDLDCVESDDVFVVLKPRGIADRTHFTEAELRPLLRQAVVAIAAAVETYVADKACSLVPAALRRAETPERLQKIPLTFADLQSLEDYERKGWGYRKLISAHLERQASANPDVIGQVFSTVGQSNVLKRVDGHRGLATGTSHKQLTALADRRNRIAHTGDRQGRGRAALSLRDVQRFYVNAKEIVEALDTTLQPA